MAANPARSPLAFSARLYERLLSLYPRRYRAEYGPAMAQLFRDLAREAYGANHGWGLAGLWVRVLADTGRSAGREQWLALEEGWRSACRVEMPWIRNGWPTLLLAMVMVVGGIWGKRAVLEQTGSVVAGVGVVVGSTLLAAVVLDRMLRARGQLLIASAAVIVSLVLPLAWTPDPVKWLQSSPLTSYTVVLLAFTWQRGQPTGRMLWGATLLYAVTNVLTSAFIGP